VLCNALFELEIFRVSNTYDKVVDFPKSGHIYYVKKQIATGCIRTSRNTWCNKMHAKVAEHYLIYRLYALAVTLIKVVH